MLKINAPNNTLVNTAPELTGTATSATAVVHVFNGSTNLGAATVAPDGSWTFKAAGVRDGKLSFTAKELVDGKFGAASGAAEYMLDTKAPAAPTVTAIRLPTKDTTPELSGRAEKGASVQVFADGVSVGTTLADALTGAWRLEVASALTEKIYTITAKATDAAGNTGLANSRPATLSIDLTTQQPTIDTVVPATTKVATQKLTGTAEAGAKVQIYADSAGTKPLLAKPVVADKNGNWKASVKLADGDYALNAIATDVAGNVSVKTADKVVTIDTKVPGVPTVNALGDSPAKTLPTTITGTAEAGATVAVYAGSVKLGQTTAGVDGAWTLSPVPEKPLRDGVQKITAKATDAALNGTKASAAVTFTLDNKAPAAPTVNTIKLPTKDTTPDLSGKAEKGAEVEVFAGTTSLGKTTATDKGVWTLTVPNAKALADATYSITATATDAAGNVGIATTRPAKLVIDTVATTPTITTTLPASSKITTQTLTGTAEAGAKVQIYGGADGTTALLTKPVTASASGTWTASVKLAEATHLLSVKATDVAGNLSDASAVKTIDIDTTAPAGPVLTEPAQLVARALPADLTGTGAEPNAKVAVYANTTKLGETTADGSGAWTFLTATYEGTFTDGVKNILARTIDAAGNLSAASNAVQFTIDTTGPTLGTASISADNASQVVLTYNEALLGTAVAVPEDFSVLVGSTPNAVTGVVVNDKTITLTLTTPVLGGTVVTVAYAAPEADQATTNPAIQDLIGNDAAAFAARAVTNSVPDITPPVISAVTVASAATLSVTSNEAGKAALYTADAALPGLTATLAAGVPGTLTVAAQSAVTTATLQVLDAALNVTVHSANPVVLGTTGADSAITLGEGDQYVFTFAGADVLTLTNAAASARVLADFTAGTDKIALTKAGVFTQLTTASAGPLDAADFLSVTSAEALTGASVVAASTAKAIVYLQDTGALYYNADGDVAGGLVLIATLVGSPDTLAAADFTVIL